MGITNIIFITIYQKDYGINYHSLPLKGKPQPPANILSDPQHTYQHTYKLAYHNSITSFITAIAMPKPPLMNLLITMSS